MATARSSNLVVAATFLVVFFLCAHVTIGDTAFSFHNFLQGEWKMEKIRTSMISKARLEESTQFLFIDPSNVTDSLSGVMFENDTDTGERLNVKKVFLELETDNTGVFKYLDVSTESAHEDHDEDQTNEPQKASAGHQTWFSFDFTGLQSSYVVSTGPLADGRGYYQCTVTAKDKFVLTIFDAKADEPEITNIIATKIAKTASGSFFQRNGMMIMVACVFLFNMWVQRKARARRPVFHQPTQRRTQDQGQQGQEQPQAEEKEGPQIEELDQNDQPVDPNKKKTN